MIENLRWRHVAGSFWNVAVAIGQLDCNFDFYGTREFKKCFAIAPLGGSLAHIRQVKNRPSSLAVIFLILDL